FPEKFDFVVCIEVLEHVTNDALALEKIYKLLKIGGRLVLSTRLERDPMHKMRIRFFGKDEFDIRVGHLKRYSKQGLVQLLESNGFKIIEIFLTEGFLRMFLFTTKAGNRLLMFASLPMVRSLLTLLDNLSAYLLGASQIFIVAEAARKDTN
ncbi:class I SAM-dependent methyltransferase, partial [candidate division NPL-UPA2 bacterium]|nr:class I SAM-dependent methyltransferase [candidate division NPL-UPA2 bacterium]